jgi:iron(III) transport system permease protein
MVPTTILYCLAAARQQDPLHEAAGRVVGASPGRILWRITLPIMRPALVYAAVMNVVAALEMLAIPLILGAPVGIHLFTTFIYERGFEAGTPDYGLVAAAAVVLMVLLGGLLAVQNLLLLKAHRFISIGTRVGRPRLMGLGHLRWAMCGLVGLYIVLAIGIVLGAVLLRAFTFVLSPYVSPLDVLTFKNFTDLVNVPVYFRSIVNTFAIATVTGIIGTALFAAVALVSQRSAFRFRRTLDAVVQVPRVLPGIMVGLGVFYASVFVPGFEMLRNSIWLLVLAYLIRYMPVGYGVLAPALLQVTTDFDRAARVTGAGWTRISVRIVLPIIKPALLSCIILLAIQSTKEYAAAIFLYAPGSEVIGSTMLTLWVQGQAGPVAALAVIQVAAVTALIAVATRVLGVKLHG